MFETVVTLKPESEWREGRDVDKLLEELDRTIRFPGMPNIWWMPIQTRTEMLATRHSERPRHQGLRRRSRRDRPHLQRHRKSASRGAGHPERLRGADDRRLFSELRGEARRRSPAMASPSATSRTSSSRRSAGPASRRRLKDASATRSTFVTCGTSGATSRA